MDNVRILGHQDDLWFLMIICNHCRSHGLIAALIKEEHITEIVTDLTPREMEKIREAAAIGADDVLDMHEFLQEFDGDFLSLFRGQEES
ncbi:MAG: hypothetical protein M1577_06725 [Chloroflexi bacterium]|nr:hypothetical protein [Chloroflexota bacterium]